MTTPEPEASGNRDPAVLAVTDATHLLSRMVAKGELACMAVALVAAVQLVRVGNQHGHGWLLLGAVIAGFGLFGCVFPALGASPKLWTKGVPWGLFALGSFGGFLTHAFAFYLAIYRGFWGLREGVSFYVILRTLVFVVLGYQLALSTYRVSEFTKGVQDGKIRVE